MEERAVYTIVGEESKQRDWAALAVQQSETFTVTTQQNYDNAAELIKDIKYKIKQIEEYWKPLKGKAYSAWKDICAKENELLAPFAKAENALKDKMKEFQRKKLEEERLLREEQERFRREEAERLMKAAEEAAKEGMEEHADYLVEEAAKVEVMEFKQPKKHKTAGTSAIKTWKARITNDSLVPVEFAGTMLRPVDTATLDRLAKATKGGMKIPGVEFYEDIQVRVR